MKPLLSYADIYILHTQDIPTYSDEIITNDIRTCVEKSDCRWRSNELTTQTASIYT